MNTESEVKTAEKCAICDVPNDIHGTCCGWVNAKSPCNAAMIIIDTRHPGFGQPLNLWKNTYKDGNEDSYDITARISYRSGWDDGIKHASLQTQQLKAEHDKLQNFKDYVHARLDAMGIPADPEPENNAAHGCRIEGRLNVIENSNTRLMEVLQEVFDKCDGVTNPPCYIDGPLWQKVKSSLNHPRK